MLFNSFEYLVFFPIVFTIYWFILGKELNLQNIFLLVASYFFYGWWDWRFLTLITLSSVLDYNIGLGISGTTSTSRKKFLLGLSLFFNLGTLVFFKYYNFFADNFIFLLNQLGFTVDTFTVNILLPVGISFYTFQTLSYTIDIYRKKIEPCKNILSFLTYVSFFPQLVAGPIERAQNLLPQFYEKRLFDYNKAIDASRQILWGFFKKVVIADNCAYFVNDIFANYHNYNSPTLVLGAVLFAFQIYGDFSGYSDIAIGTARLLGFDLMQNFAFPYFSRDIAEFWRRWHISLSTWFRDYIYIPLGGSRVGQYKSIRNIFIIFVVSGFWHGANWTYIVWGGLNALYFLPQFIFKTNRNYIEVVAKNSLFPSLKEILSILTTFMLTTLAWIFFRSKTISDAFNYIFILFTNFEWSMDYKTESISLYSVLFFIFIMLVFEWKNRKRIHGLARVSSNKLIRYSVYLILSIMILQNFNTISNFIYFQF